MLFLISCMMGTIALAKDAQSPNWPQKWASVWPKTDFKKTNISYDEIMEGGPSKNGIPAIDHPIFRAVSAVTDIGNEEPVISLNIKGDVRAYPLRILMFHEIVNDTAGGVPITVTYCPLCNAALVFERTLEGQVLDFGTTGKLRMSDMVMYDRQSESWWQQFTGEAIVGKYTGKMLKTLPSRIESYQLFKNRYPDGKVLVPNNRHMRRYGENPYLKYDSSGWPFLFRGEYDGSVVPPLARVVVVGQDAWPLSLIRKEKTIKYKGIILSWHSGQNSPLDSYDIKDGKDIGNVVVTKDGQDIVYNIPFAFAFKAFQPRGIIHYSSR